MRDEQVHTVVAKHISKSKCTKHTRFGPLLEVELSKKCTPLWRKAHSQVKMHKAHQAQITFGSWDVEKVHAVVAQSTFPSQNAQSTPCSDHFWKLRCRKSACCCGAKHISKSKCTRHTMLRPLLEVEMSKKCTVVAPSTFPSQNVQKTTAFWRSGVEKVHEVVARSAFPSQKFKKMRESDHFLNLHYTALHYITVRYTTANYATLHNTPLHYTALHYTTLHYTTLHYTTLHYNTVYYTTLHYLQLHYIPTTAALHHTLHPAIVGEATPTIRDSQQPTSPIGFLFWNFRHRLVRYYWYIFIDILF